MIVTLIITFAILIGVSEFATFATYGKFLKDDQVLDFLYEYEPFEKNPFDNDILGPSFDKENIASERNLKIVRNSCFISRTRFSLLSKYYISGYGRVLRWSTSHGVINRLYNISKTPRQ